MLQNLMPHTAAALTAHLPAAGDGSFPELGRGVAPPGSEKIVQIMQWGLWLATAGCILAAVMAGVQIALSATRGDHQRQSGSLLWVLAGAVVVGSSTGIVSTLL